MTILNKRIGFALALARRKTEQSSIQTSKEKKVSLLLVGKGDGERGKESEE
jgi:hypothetical protein